MGITLINVPFWWNKTVGSLAATILQHRADLTFLQHVAEIPIATKRVREYQRKTTYKANQSNLLMNE